MDAEDTPWVCPRCGATTTQIRAKSAVANVWTVFGCDTCLYTWRSTEPKENTDRTCYPNVFRLHPEDIAKMPVVPSIPPLRPKG
ncbi:non-oxidative hydroxyarylic acid decarboxylases subunit D [Cupriavidus pampae]|uniref:Protein VdcD n=1 Tax=Cupriavidus pampae TaxID=659251 RepID=A0ABN7ZKJ3_9BURK|nr:non-oxidative hydroxyarylic acid decarboxylases subunit D [Cupriavidus pampae]CAG9184619.1 Protein VdcD [Cupriavidus pampae]